MCIRDSLGPAGIALMDIVDFKICNDTYGHHAGDLALETVAKAIRLSLIHIWLLPTMPRPTP